MHSHCAQIGEQLWNFREKRLPEIQFRFFRSLLNTFKSSIQVDTALCDYLYGCLAEPGVSNGRVQQGMGVAYIPIPLYLIPSYRMVNWRLEFSFRSRKRTQLAFCDSSISSVTPIFKQQNGSPCFAVSCPGIRSHLCRTLPVCGID